MSEPQIQSTGPSKYSSSLAISRAVKGLKQVDVYDQDYLNFIKGEQAACPAEKLKKSLIGYSEALKRYAETKFFAGMTDVPTLCKQLRTYETAMSKEMITNQMSHEMFSCMWGLVKLLSQAQMKVNPVDLMKWTSTPNSGNRQFEAKLARASS